MAQSTPSDASSQAAEAPPGWSEEMDSGPGPRGPPTRHKIVTISRLDYRDYSPNGCAPHLMIPDNPATYVEYGRRMEPHWRSCGFVVRMSGQYEVPCVLYFCKDKVPLHHWQIYYEDEREDPSIAELYALFDVRPWQIHFETCGNPKAASLYCSKASKRAGGDLVRIGTHPPEGRFEGFEKRRNGHGGAREGAGRPSGEPAAKKPRSDWHKQVVALSQRVGTTFEEVIQDPTVLYALPPSLMLARMLFNIYDVPNFAISPDRKMYMFHIHGPSKCGKSHEADDFMKRNNIKYMKLRPLNGLFFKWWERLKGNEEGVVLEDFDGQCWFRDLINIADPTDQIGDAKHTSVILRLRFIITTGPCHPRDFRFFFDSPTKRRKMISPIDEIAHLMNRYQHGGIYMWTRFPERPCICYNKRGEAFAKASLDEMASALIEDREAITIKFKTCEEFNGVGDMAAAYGYAPCNPPPPDEKDFSPADPIHQIHQPHLPSREWLLNPTHPVFGPPTESEVRMQTIENLLKGLIFDDVTQTWKKAPPAVTYEEVD